MILVPVQLEKEQPRKKIRWNGNEPGMNRPAFFPVNYDYKIECRLLLKKYNNGEAHARCREIHGTTFEGMFCSGSYYVFYSGKVRHEFSTAGDGLHAERDLSPANAALAEKRRGLQIMRGLGE